VRRDCSNAEGSDRIVRKNLVWKDNRRSRYLRLLRQLFDNNAQLRRELISHMLTLALNSSFTW
jgi:hypothetical protein